MESKQKTTGYYVSKVITYVFLIILAFIMLIPFAWMISSSLKLEKDVFAFPIQWIPTDPQWSNYSEIWKKVPLVTGFLNSTKLTIIVTILQILTSSFAAYAFAKLEFKGRNLVFMLYVMT
ncbi:MAG: carbohydrate ABC transporter permease, partial [Eubacterium sp.]|nr:carbohydrate ABC transporter permease [Eubacterium sp.]